MERDQLIFNYLDNLSSNEERQFVEHLLATDNEFANEFAEIQQMNALMLENPIETAPKNFARNVMSAIKESESVQFVQQSNLIKVLVGVITFLSLIVSLKFMQVDLPEYIVQLTKVIPTKLAIYSILMLTFWAFLEYYLSKKEMENTL